MTVPRPSRFAGFVLLLSIIPLSATVAVAQERESIIDRFVRIEETLFMKIPETPRWEEQLDLLGRREEAIARYQHVVDMNPEGGMRHDQYGLSYEYGPYAAERVENPFQRLENTWP